MGVFNDWIETYNIIKKYILHYNIGKDEQIALSLHLTHLFSYNAGLSNEEINGLGYQASPFQYRKENSYLRIDKIQALVSLASDIVKKNINVTGIIIDNKNFVKVISDYCQVLAPEKVEIIKENILVRKLTFIHIENEEDKTTTYVENAYSKIVNDFLNFPKDYIAYICSAITKKPISIKDNNIIENNFLSILIMKYKGKIINDLANKENFTKAEKGILFKCYNNIHKITFKIFEENIDKHKNEILQEIIKYLNENELQIGNIFKQTLIENFKQEIVNQFNEISKFIVVGYFKDVQGISVLVTPSISQEMKALLIDKIDFRNFGYTADMVSLERCLLKLEEQPIDLIEKLLNKQKQQINDDIENEKFEKAIKKFSTKALEKEELDNILQSNDINKSFASFEETCKDNKTFYISLQAKAIIKIIEGLEVLRKSNLIVLWRLNAEFKKATEHANANEIAKYLRSIQNMHEAILLHLALFPLDEHILSDSINKLIKNDNLQKITLCNYGMKTFSQVFNSIKYTLESKTNDIESEYIIQVSNQNYFEFLINSNNANFSLYQFRSTQDIRQNAKVIFIDMHPNNAVEALLFGHNVTDIFDKIWLGHNRAVKTLGENDPIWINFKKNKRLTLVVDATLNNLQEDNICELLEKAKIFITYGLLNLVLVQSLAKFVQLGMDKLNGGLIIAYNNNDKYWRPFNENLKRYQQEEKVDILVNNYFAVLYKFASEEQRQYLSKLHENTQYLYHKLMSKLQSKRNIFNITPNADDKTCYIAINCLDLFEENNKNDCFTDNSLHAFNRTVIKNLITPIAYDKLAIPVTHRMSIGFPLTNIHDTAYTIRLTAGIEEKETLDKYVKIIQFACFALAQINPTVLFRDEKSFKDKLQETVESFKEEFLDGFDRADDKPKIIKKKYPLISSGELKFNLDLSTFNLTFTHFSLNETEPQTFSSDQLFINENILKHLLSAPLPARPHQTQSNSAVNITPYQQRNSNMAFPIATQLNDLSIDNSYYETNCVTFSKLPNDLKKIIFSNLNNFNILLKNKVSTVENLEITKRRGTEGNGFSIYRNDESNFIEIVIDMWSIKSPTVSKFCKLLCIFITFKDVKIDYDAEFKKLTIAKDLYQEKVNEFESSVKKVTLIARRNTGVIYEFIVEYLKKLENAELNVNRLKYHANFLQQLKEKFDELSLTNMIKNNNQNADATQLGYISRNPTPTYQNRSSYLSKFFKSVLSPFSPAGNKEALSKKLMREKLLNMEHFCNLIIFRLSNKLHLSIPNLVEVEAKLFYKNIGYWLRENFSAETVKDFEAKKEGLILLIASSQEAKDLKKFLKNTIAIFLKENPCYVLFTHTIENADSVHLAGDFNNWLSPLNTVIQDLNLKYRMGKVKSNKWQLIVKLEPGQYQFKFVVNKCKWEHNLNYENITTTDGHINSVVNVVLNPKSQNIGGVSQLIFDVSNFIGHEPLVYLMGKFNQGQTKAEVFYMTSEDLSIWLKNNGNLQTINSVNSLIEKMNNLSSLQKLFVPINIGEFHFVLLAIMKNTKGEFEIVYFDSINSNQKFSIISFIKKIFNKYKFNLTPLIENYQLNHNCAIHIYEASKLLMTASVQQFNEKWLRKEIQLLKLHNVDMATSKRLEFAKEIVANKNNLSVCYSNIIITPELRNFQHKGTGSQTKISKIIRFTQEDIKKFGGRVVDAGGEGDCLFRSISAFLYKGDSGHHLELRKHAVTTLEGYKNKDSLIDYNRPVQTKTGYIKPTGFDNYFKLMSTEGTWGGFIEIKALVQYLQRPIFLFSDGKYGHAYNIINYDLSENRIDGEPLLLFYCGNSHYRYIETLPNKTVNDIIDSAINLLNENDVIDNEIVELAYKINNLPEEEKKLIEICLYSYPNETATEHIQRIKITLNDHLNNQALFNIINSIFIVNLNKTLESSPKLECNDLRKATLLHSQIRLKYEYGIFDQITRVLLTKTKYDPASNLGQVASLIL